MMAPFITYSYLLQGLIGGWFWALFVWSAAFMIVCFKRKRKVSAAFRNAMMILVTWILYTLYQLESSLRLEIRADFAKYVDLFGKTPMWKVIAVSVFFTLLLIVWTAYSHKWTENHVSDATIKTAIDTLPAGICIFEETGRIVLKNDTMEKVCLLLTGKDLLNGCTLEQVIRTSDALVSDREKIVIRLSDDSTWSFVKKELTGKDISFAAIEAYNVTEEYAKTLLLQERKESLKKLNEKLVTYSNNIISTIAAQEVLNAKVKIHDEMGETLLAIKHYLKVRSTCDEKEMILDKLNRNIGFLQRELEEASNDEYELMISTAKKIGIEVIVSGNLPVKEPAKHVIATGIHECFTNTLRHAKGDTLWLKIEYHGDIMKAEFSNNGDSPVGEIVEKGGLSSLRSLVEQSGGTMEIVSLPSFLLKITMPVEEENVL